MAYNLGLCILVCLMTAVCAYPKGAPVQVCETMKPGGPHDDYDYYPKTTTSEPAFEIQFMDEGGNTYSPGMTKTGVLQGSYMYFKGFMLRSFFKDNWESAGTFVPINSTSQARTCGNFNDMLTHTSNSYKYFEYFEWIAPSYNYEGRHIVFQATVVVSKYDYYTGIKTYLSHERTTVAGAEKITMGTLTLLIAVLITRIM